MWNTCQRMIMVLTVVVFVLALAVPVWAEDLVYWSMWNEEEQQGVVLKKAIAAFEKAHPDVKVKVVWNGRESRNMVGPALEAGEQIDVFETDGLFINANLSKWTIDMTDYLDRPALGEDGKSVRQSIVTQALLKQVQVNGRDRVVPHQPYAVMYFYNKKHFEAAGVTPPSTWDEFIAVLKKLKEAGYGPVTTDDAYRDLYLGYYAERAVGCDGLLKAIQDKSGASWRDPIWMQMAEDMIGLREYFAEGTDGFMYPAGQQALALGEVTMYLNGTWFPSEVLSTTGPDFQWGSFGFPTVHNGINPNTDTMMGAQSFAISSTSKNPDLAFELIKYMESKEAQTDMAVIANVPPTHIDSEWPAALAETGAIVKSAEVALPWSCNIGAQGEIVTNVVMPTFVELFTGKLTAKEYAEKMATDSAKFWSTQK